MTRTIVATGYGGPEVPALQDIELPDPGPAQVLVEVRAAGTNPIDYKLYSGQMGNDPANLPLPVGMEAAGVIVSVSPEATGYTGGLTVGDEVIVTNIDGGYADRVVAEAADVGHKPENLSFEQAAGLLLVAGTAWHLLTNTGVGTGDTVLIHGASPARHDQLREYGADPIAYGDGLADRVRAIGTVDAALDLVGTDEALDTSVELVADRGRIATIAGFGRAPGSGIAALTGADGGQDIRDASRVEVIRLAAAGQLDVTVDRSFPLAAAAEAHHYLQTGHARGKVVLVP